MIKGEFDRVEEMEERQWTEYKFKLNLVPRSQGHSRKHAEIPAMLRGKKESGHYGLGSWSDDAMGTFV